LATDVNIDKLFDNVTQWREEADRLRAILLDCGLTEELKWGKPCYGYDGKNICIIQRMKGFLALLFFKGALLDDPDGLLEAQGPNSRVGYRMRFTDVREVANAAGPIKAYVRQAIEIENAGLTVDKSPDLEYPEELIGRFEQDPDFKAAFDGLTLGRRRGYVLHFRDAKQSKTRAARIDKCRQRILAGKGLHDR